MSRGVLGNDPFRRGAAARPDEDGGHEEKAPAKAAPKKRGTKPRKAETGSKRAKAPAAAVNRAPSSEPPPQVPRKRASGSAASPQTVATGASRRAKEVPGAATTPASTPTGKGSPTRRPAPAARKKPPAASPRSGASARPADRVGAPPPPAGRHLTPVAPTSRKAPSAPSSPPPAGVAHPEPSPVAEVVHLPGRGPGPSRAGAPHLMLVSDGTPEVEAAEPRFPRDDDDLATRAGRALAFARDLATAGLQGPALTRSARVGRGLVRAALSGVGSLWGQQVDTYGRDPQLVEDLEPLTELLYAHYWRVTVQGAVHVPSGPVLLVANHAGVMPFDGPVLQQVLTRERPDLAESRWLIEDQIFHAPFFGTLFNRLGALRACPQNARRLLSEGRPVIVFPEGAQGLGKPFRERGKLKRFGRGGFVKIALRAQVPIVPVAIIGSEETSPLVARLPGSIFGLGYVPVTPLGPLPLPARWMVRFGEPLQLDGAGPEDADNLPVVQRLSERTRDSIQGMREALLRERGGAYFG